MTGAVDPAELAPLLVRLERARELGYLGPGDIADHVQHTEGFRRALDGVTGQVVDLGSGAGVPGLIIALARPDLHLVLVEAAAKRCRFLESAIASLGIDVDVLEGRAEVVGRGPLRGLSDAVVARSFGAPSATAECAAPLLRVGGLLVVSEPPTSPPDRWSPAGLGRLGLALEARQEGPPHMQLLRQVEECPNEFPRRDGVPAKKPLF